MRPFSGNLRKPRRHSHRHVHSRQIALEAKLLVDLQGQPPQGTRTVHSGVQKVKHVCQVSMAGHEACV